MYVIGTAGHVDHGKSTLIEALTGIDPDRLAEEKERAMTIDLGFAWMRMEVAGQSEEVGVVDVPGHRDFIENMLAGIGGIDLALFVVAADEGVMPQTSEHLAIVDLLGIPGGVVALTKVDLVDDPDWLELVTLDLQETLVGTVLEDAPIVAVSARTGQGLPQLHDEVASRLAATQPRPDLGRPRLPIDRVFTLPGFGTIVTGTLSGGHLSVGDAVDIQPGGLQGRIRGLQTHKTKRESAAPGTRVAVNVSGIDAVDLRRGLVLAHPESLRATVLVDASYRHLATAGVPLKHNVEVKFFSGAAEVMARTRVIGARRLEPGQSGWLQLALSEPVALDRGDRFILRRPSPGATLGGGWVLDPHPGRRHRRFQQVVLERMKTLSEGTPEELLLQRLERLQPVLPEVLFKKSSFAPGDAKEVWADLVSSGSVLRLGQYAVTDAYWRALRRRALAYVHDYHRQYPLRKGMPREELRSRLELSVPVYNALAQRLVDSGDLLDSAGSVSEPGHEVVFNQEQQQRVDELMKKFEQAGVNSPAVKESKALAGEGVYEALVELGYLYQLNEEVVYRSVDFEPLVKQIVDYIQTHESAGAAEIRDLLNTSRKYAIALLEYLDQRRITRRVGDERVLLRQPSEF